ncbi:PREDICTED: gamma-glutamyltranspeptidase 1 [Drosophila arizonae]|uniref:Gamma-glutamyltranspeptidase 1 n=1 Tax=Drosophila arizonae TaxID=7263 RepID=A0ABM1PXA0_DROAR|nr:PREDICTED: gamma-glutamyltranspeptidase 1 [Drosophila arizonae]
MRLLLNKKSLVWLSIIALMVTGLTLGLVFGLRSRDTRYITGAVVSNGIGCAEVGGNMLQEGGSAVDAAIATLLCEGIMLPHSMGIGGGFVATIYTRRTRKVETVIARESAPAAAHKEMFVGQKEVTGALAGGVPGEILGYWEMHQKYGRLPWKDLFQPSIKMAREGHVVSRYLAAAISSKITQIKSDPALAKMFLNEKGEPYVEHDYMKRPALANTLERIANNGAGELYDGGETGVKFVEDIRKLGGIITLEDLKNYKCRWESDGIISANVTGGFTLYTTPLPSSGPVLAFILNVMSELYSDNEPIYWQRVIETFKHAYGQRTNLGDYENDPEYGDSIKAQLEKLLGHELVDTVRSLIKDDKTSQDYMYYGANFTVEPDHGTAHMNVLASNGDAISITSTINTYFGAKVASPQTGIILNDEMDDFSTPGVINSFGVPSSPANYIYPHKRPMSSMNPSIIVDENGDVRMLVGAAGGTKITTSVATVIMKYLIRRESMAQAVNNGRLHHQLIPMQIDYEEDVDAEVIEYLRGAGHAMNDHAGDGGFAAVTAIGALHEPEPFYDRRRVGSVMTITNTNKMNH